MVTVLATASVPKDMFPDPVFKVKIPLVVVYVVPFVPVLKLTAVAPVMLPRVKVLATASVPREIFPDPVLRVNIPLVVVYVVPAVPVVTLTAVVVVLLPMAIVWATALVPKLRAPVPVLTLTAVAPLPLPRFTVAPEAPARLKVVAAAPRVTLVGEAKRLAVAADEFRSPTTVTRFPLAIRVLLLEEFKMT
jgi:hypothetical protein